MGEWTVIYDGSWQVVDVGRCHVCDCGVDPWSEMHARNIAAAHNREQAEPELVDALRLLLPVAHGV